MPTAETIKEHGGALNLAQSRTPVFEAGETLSVFQSVGTTHFDVTIKDDSTEACTIDRRRTVRGLYLSLPEFISLSERQQKLHAL